MATGTKTQFLNLSNRLVPGGVLGPDSYDERDFLGVAFHPDYQLTGTFYTYTPEPKTAPPTFPSTLPLGLLANHQNVVAEWHANAPGVPAAGATFVRVLMRSDWPQFNNNGGGDNSANGQYGIPADTPFVTVPSAIDEIYAYGLRSPYGMSFDTESGALVTGDIDQNDLEEVDVIVMGGHYGWPRKEGTPCFDHNGILAGFATRTVRPPYRRDSPIRSPTGPVPADDGAAWLRSGRRRRDLRARASNWPLRFRNRRLHRQAGRARLKPLGPTKEVGYLAPTKG